MISNNPSILPRVKIYNSEVREIEGKGMTLDEEKIKLIFYIVGGIILIFIILKILGGCRKKNKSVVQEIRPGKREFERVQDVGDDWEDSKLNG